MVRLARARLEPYAPRAGVELGPGGPPVDEPTGAYDRFVSNYVFDLLSHEDIRAMIREAHRMLSPGGLICLAGLTGGEGFVSRLVAGVFRGIHAVYPSLLGGCRPVELLPFLPEPQWQVRHASKVVAFGVPSEVVVAERL